MKTLPVVLAAILIPSQASAQLISKSLDQDGTERTYLVYVPASYDGQQKVPLVINFHGFTWRASWHASFTEMNAVADTAGFLIAYPQGLDIYNPLGYTDDRGWNLDGELATQDDVDFTRRLIDHIDAEYALDLTRVHATGFSYGGMMSFTVACQLGDRIASTASVGGAIWRNAYENCTTTRPLSILLFYGTMDRIAPYHGEARVMSAQTTARYWATHNNCKPSPVQTPLEDIDTTDGSTVVLYEYVDCDMGCEVNLYKIIGGGHTWPGVPGTGPYRDLGNINQDIEASSIMWDFFQRHPHPNTAVSAEATIPPKHIEANVYPNPSPGRFVVEADLPRTSIVRMALMNVLGQEVSLLVDRTFVTGRHRITWISAGRNLPPGLYVLRIGIGDETVTKPLIMTQ